MKYTYGGKIQSTVDYNTENITLLVNPDENGNAYGEYIMMEMVMISKWYLVLLVLNAPP